MKEALIIGDSWSITLTHNYWVRWKPDQTYGPSHADHIEFAMRKVGYAVNNRGWGGSSNHIQVTQALHYLTWHDYIGKPLDVIIWFHTELLRDWHRANPREVKEMKEYGLDAWLDYKATEVYGIVRQAQEQYPNTKWIIVGGHCPVRQSHRHLLNKSALIIDNWRQELAGVECPECHTLTFLDEFEKFKDCFPIDIVERELNLRDKIINACRDTKIFYDKVHPGPESMGQLSERIVNFIKAQEQNNEV